MKQEYQLKKQEKRRDTRMMQGHYKQFIERLRKQETNI